MEDTSSGAITCRHAHGIFIATGTRTISTTRGWGNFYHLRLFLIINTVVLNTYFERPPPTFYLTYLTIFLNVVIFPLSVSLLCGIYSDVLSGLCFDVYSGILSFFLANIMACYLACTYGFYIMTFKSIWHMWKHSIWQIFWPCGLQPTWHTFWHPIWHTFWHSIRHILWQNIWHSIWHRFGQIIWRAFWHVFWQSISDIPAVCLPLFSGLGPRQEGRCSERWVTHKRWIHVTHKKKFWDESGN